MKFYLAVACLVLLSVSCGKTTPPQTLPLNASPSVIRTAPVAQEALVKKVILPGQITLTEGGRADITAPLSGTVVRLLAKVGDYVVKNQPVALLNNIYGQTSLQIVQKLEQDKAALSQAEDNAKQAAAELDTASLDLARKKDLFNAGVISRSDLTDAQTRYTKASAVSRDMSTVLEIARTALNRDEAILNRARLGGAGVPNGQSAGSRNSKYFNEEAAKNFVSFYVRSPIAGTVTSVNVTPGFSVNPGSLMVSVVNTDKVYADANAYESDLPWIHPGDSITVLANSFPEQIFSGKISYVGKILDPATRTALVRSLLQNPTGVLRGGMFISVTVSPSHTKPVVVIPENAVLTENGAQYVFVETSPGHYEKRTVHVGLISDHKAEILSGLRVGEKIVIEGALLLEGSPPD